MNKAFERISSTPLPTMRGEAIQLRHPNSGARILHIKCPDAENCFCIAVPTPPPDDTGMPHILEHMTLAGSRKFPCKEPFFEMIKRSVATFINALTGNDITYYPVCSTVKADLFNLADVYFDAVFHPLLSEMTFAREAYHLAPADPANPTGEFRCDGIVYSEMKGVFSSSEGILERDTIRKLLPDTCHGKESGGNPESIPDLSLSTLREFHARRYNPSNAFIILFGDIPTEEWLEFLEPRLAEFKPLPVMPPIARQPRWVEPRSYGARYPLPEGEDTAGKTFLAMNWLVGDATDLAFSARMAILSYLLCGNDAAPLTKAVNDSHAGANIIMSSGLSNGMEYTWHIAVDGAEPSRMDLFRDTVMATLEELSKKPFDQGDIDAAFQQTVYSCNEIDSMYAFNNAMAAATAWCAGIDPATILERAPHMDRAREEILADPMLLPRMVRELFLENRHRLDIVLTPDHGLAAEQDAALARRLAARRAAMSDAEAEAIAKAAAELEVANARPNGPDDIACLPKLGVSDMPPLPVLVETSTIPLPRDGILLASENIATNGIVYIGFDFDLGGMPRNLVPFLQLYAEAIDEFGAGGLDYAATARKRARCLGLLQARHSARIHMNGSPRPSLTFSMKTTMSSLDDALEALREAIFELNPRDPAHMADVLMRQRAELRSYFVQDARALTRNHAARNHTAAGARDYLTMGFPLLHLVERLAGAESGAAYEECASAIEAIRDWILSSHRVTASVVAPPECRDKVAKALSSWIEAMPAGAAAAKEPGFTPDLAPRNEGLSAALQVSFSALFAPAPRYGDPDCMNIAVGSSLVSSDYMLPEIRFKGNAYGAGFSYDMFAGTCHFSSYRDPRIAETYATMLRSVEYVKNARWTDDAVKNAILTVAKGFVAPFRPSRTFGIMIHRHVVGETDEIAIANYRALLSVKAKRVKDATVAALEAALPHASYAVAASEAALAEAAKSIPNLTIEPIIR